MKYYIVVNNERQGPFSYEELAVKGISAETLVWAEGMTGWQPAAQVDVLKNIVKMPEVPAAPPVPANNYQPAAVSGQQSADGHSDVSTDYQQPINGYQQPYAQPVQKRGMRGWLKFLIGLFVFLLILAGVMFATNPDKEQHKEALTEILNTATKTGLQGTVSDDNAELGSSVLSAMVNKLFDEFFEFHNYGLFSTCTFKGSGKRVSLGLFTKVFTFDKDEIVRKVTEGKQNLNSFGNALNNGLNSTDDNAFDKQDKNTGTAADSATPSGEDDDNFGF